MYHELTLPAVTIYGFGSKVFGGITSESYLESSGSSTLER